jgi:DNA-3-methyladenine glycosylase
VRKILRQKFFDRSTLKVAEDLLGKYLVRIYRGKTVEAMITEVEAYDGFKDKASHASRGMTSRNKIMFGPAGYFYVYFTYGMHWMPNIVCGKEGYPAAVLIRGVEGINGPARVAKSFHIGNKLNGKPANKRSGLWLEDRGVRTKITEIKKSPRIGVAYAGPVWANKKLRFSLKK